MHIKICCISSLAEAKLALAKGATALGLVSAMPSGPGVIEEELMKSILQSLPDSINTFLLTAETKVGSIVAQHQRLPTRTLQLVDALTEGTYDELKMALPKVTIVQVLHILNESNIEEAVCIAPQVDALLLDSGNPNLKVKQLGGTGKQHDWAISATIVKQVDIPVYLAGGLTAKNVQAAIRQVQPFGVDVCSGVRSGGQLDEKKLMAFVQEAKKAV